MSEPFDQLDEHTDDALARRLEALGRAVPGSPALTQRIMNQIGGARPTTHNLRIGRWIMRGSIGLAACALIGTFLWTLLITEPQHAYGIDDARAQLAKVNSLYVKGTGQDGASWEVYVARPDHCYRVQSGFRIAQTSDKSSAINDRDKTATIMPGDPLDARFMTEVLMQTQLFTQLLGPPDEEMKKVRTDRIGNVDVDVYEKVGGAATPSSIRREVFLNPKTGLPVKSVLYMKAGKEPEMTLATIDHIEANGPAPKGAFDFAVPAGYAKQDPPPSAGRTGASAFNSATADTLHLEQSYNFEIGDGKAALLCWALYDDREPGKDMDLPAKGMMTLEGSKGGYVEHLLRTDAAPDGHHWRWSLFVPSDAKTSVVNNPLTMTVTRHSTVSFAGEAVKFKRDELAKLVVEAQRRTAPEGAKPMTLEQIEQKLAEVSAKH